MSRLGIAIALFLLLAGCANRYGVIVFDPRDCQIDPQSCK